MSEPPQRSGQYLGAFVVIPAHALPESEASRSRAAVMYCFTAFILARMWMIAIAEQNVQLIVFSSIGVLICVLVCWMRRRRARMERELGFMIQSDQLFGPVAMQQQLQLPPRRAGAPASTIERLTRIRHSEECKSYATGGGIHSAAVAPDVENQVLVEEGHYGTECSICLCEFEQDQELIVLDCRHAFHTSCVLAWLQYNVTCPLCKQDVRTPEEREADV